MKIIFLSRSLHLGGAERQLTVLAKGLRHLGHDVKVAVFYSGGPLEADLNADKIPIIYLDKKCRGHAFSFFLRLTRVVRREHPDILHSYLVIPNILTILLKPFFPSGKMIWGVRASNVDVDRYDLFSRLTYRIECKLSRFADLIICNSHAGMEYAALHGFPKNRMVVVPNGIDTDRFHFNPEPRARIRSEWGIQEREKLIGLVARLDPMKDHPTFIRAAARLAKQRPDVRFVCVGGGPKLYRSELISLSHQLGLAGKLIWAGLREDMPNVYNSLDVAVSSSYGEGFPNAIAEAMACGVPCVVTDVGDSARIVGNAGVVVPAKDSDALAAGLSHALNGIKPANRFLHERIKDRFSYDILIKATEDLFVWAHRI